MKILEKHLSYLHPATHGYFAAQKHFKGTLQREIFVSMYDQETKTSCRAFLFIASGNVLLFAHELNGEQNVLVEFESNDEVKIIPNGNDYLMTILNDQPGTEKSLSFHTTRPIDLIEVNKRYLFVVSIVPDLRYGTAYQLNLDVTYTIESDYNEKLANVVTVMKAVMEGKEANFSQKLPGMTSSTATFVIYSQIAGFILLQFFLLWMIIASPSSAVVALIFDAVLFYTLLRSKK